MCESTNPNAKDEITLMDAKAGHIVSSEATEAKEPSKVEDVGTKKKRKKTKVCCLRFVELQRKEGN
jgi:hypothetical protein